MQNKTPHRFSLLVTLGEDMATGCHNHQTAIGLLQNKEVNVRADLLSLCTADNTYQAAKTGKIAAVQAQLAADILASQFIMIARDRLKTLLGTSWSQSWSEAGFVNNSFAVPSSFAARQALLLKLKDYFAAHVGHEADQIGVTGSAAETHHDALAAARATVNACRADVVVKRAARSTQARNFRKRTRGLITELGQLLPGDDGRWRAFGLNPPSAVGLPDVPEGLVVLGGGPGHLLANWNSSPLADRYDVFRKIVGVDDDYVLARTVTETETDLNTFTTGQLVLVRVAARNEAGTSQKSEPVQHTVP